MEHFLKNLIQIRKDKRLTQENMAEKMGVSLRTYNNYERGITQIEMANMYKIANILEVSPEKLLSAPKAKVISFVNRKGGVGKSTMAALFSTAFAYWTDFKILVLDTDSQMSLCGLAERTPVSDQVIDRFEIRELNTYNTQTPTHDVIRTIEQAQNNYDLIFVDTQGSFSDGEITNTILTLSDVCIIPLQATTTSLESTALTLAAMPIIKNKRLEEGKEFKVLGVINQRNRTNENKEILAVDGQFGVKLMKNSLGHRVRYHREIGFHKPICEQGSEDEFFNLFVEVAKEI